MRVGAGIVLACLAIGLPHVTQAGGVPVIDVQSLVQETLQAERTLVFVEQQAKQYERQIEELAVAIEQRDALRGARGLGQLLNGPAERAARRSLPGTLEELLRLAESGQVPTLADLQRLYALREAELDAASPTDLGLRGPEDSTSKVYERVRTSTVASLAVSEKAYGDAARRVGTYEGLLDAIDRAEDLKASTDLASRIEAENGLVLNELVRLQSLQMARSAAAGANELVGRSNLSEFAEFDEAAFRDLARRLEIQGAR